MLILFENGDTPLADVQLKDVIPPGYEMDGCDVRANKELLDNVEMTQETTPRAPPSSGTCPASKVRTHRRLVHDQGRG